MVEQLGVALDQYHEVLQVLEVEPGAAIADGVARHRRRGVERWSHALAELAIPAARGGLDVDAGLAPEALLLGVGAARIAAREKRLLLRRDLLQRGDDVLAAADMGGIGLRADQDEVVVHDLAAIDAVAGFQEFELGRLVVDEDHVGVAVLADRQGLAGSHRDNVHLDPARLGEGGEQERKQPRLLGRGGRGDGDEKRLGLRRAGQGQHRRQRQQGADELHVDLHLKAWCAAPCRCHARRH